MNNNISKPEQFFTLARAYADASLILCGYFDNGSKIQAYPRAFVILYLAHHAVELFLKGAIFSRSAHAKLHHNIDELKNTFDQLYSDPGFSWEPPFKTQDR
ncbi:MAG: hypothetical protein AB1487_03620 [Thermodesulfobacteriota bacterium]